MKPIQRSSFSFSAQFCAAAGKCAALVLLVSFSAPLLTAQTASSNQDHGARGQAISNLMETLDRTRIPLQAAISPDGLMVAWVAPVANAGERIHLRLLHAAADSTQVISSFRADAQGSNECDQSNIAWSPDSRRIAFVSDCAAAGQSQIFLSDISANPSGSSTDSLIARQVTSLKGYLHDLAWSPDGKQLGFLFVENATRPPDPMHPIKPQIGVISTQTMAEVQRIAVINVAAANHDQPQVTQVTPANLHVYEFDWAPDSTRLAYIAAAPPGDDNWYLAQLYTQSVDGGSPHSIVQPKTQIAVPRWSPDGKRIAFIGGLMSDEGITGGDIYLVPSAGGAVRNLTSGRKSSPAWPHWLDNRHLAFTESVDGEARFSVVDAGTGIEDKSARVTFLATVGDGVRQLSLSLSGKIPSGNIQSSNIPSDNIQSSNIQSSNIPSGSTPDRVVAAVIQSSFHQPPEVWAGPLKNLSQITHLNDSLQAPWGKSESLIWNNDGFRVQGWLMYPKNYDPRKKYPMIVWVHGGPASKVLPNWPPPGYTPVAFSALGYFVLMPNVRGSFGEGEAFTAANRKDFGYGDLRDLLAGIDAVTKKFPVDPNRIGITGVSYGGFMSMFAITQTHRFHAAVAEAGISNWKSYYGENSIDQWMVPYFGASVYDDPAVYARSSPINFIRNARTPTLIVVGDRDGECPAPQSFEMWHALRTMHVPVELVVYPNEGHALSDPKDRRDVLERAIGWFDQYLPPSPPSNTAITQQEP
jgi:dipeptidyl aminopeptidase/acylaminoacyl peptidase